MFICLKKKAEKAEYTAGRKLNKGIKMIKAAVLTLSDRCSKGETKDESGKIWLFTRRLENVSKQFPDVIEYVKKNVRGKSFIIETLPTR